MDPYAQVCGGKLKLKSDNGVKKKKKHKNAKVLEQVTRTIEAEVQEEKKPEIKRTKAEIAFQKMQEKMAFKECRKSKKEHIRHLLLLAFREGSTATKAARDICAVYGDDAIAKRTAQHWFSRFLNGDFNLRNRTPTSRQSKFDEERLNQRIHEDLHQAREFVEEMDCDHSTIARRL